MQSRAHNYQDLAHWRGWVGGRGAPSRATGSRRATLLLGLVALALASCDGGAPVTQPIAFSHKTHVDNGLECVFCHASVEKAQHAGVPADETCMLCHEGVTNAAAGAGVAEQAKVQEYATRGEPIPWRRIYDLPDHVFFSHRRHVAVAGIECARCHGDVPALVLPASRPLVDQNMDWCIGCHAARGASNDCIHCHR